MNVEDLGRRRRRLLVRSVSSAQGEPYAAEDNAAPPDSGEMAVSAFAQSLWGAPSLPGDNHLAEPTARGPVVPEARPSQTDLKKPSAFSRALGWIPGVATASRDQSVLGPARVESQHLDSVLQALGASSMKAAPVELSALGRPHSPLTPDARTSSLKKAEGLDSQGRTRVPSKFFVPRPAAPAVAVTSDGPSSDVPPHPSVPSPVNAEETVVAAQPAVAPEPASVISAGVASNVSIDPIAKSAAEPAAKSDVASKPEAASPRSPSAPIVTPAVNEPITAPQLDPVVAALQKLAELAAVVTPAVTPLAELQKAAQLEAFLPAPAVLESVARRVTQTPRTLRTDRPGAQRSRAKLAVLHQEAAALSTRISELASLVDQCGDDSAEDSLIAWDDCRRLAAILHQELERGLPLPEFQATR